MLFLGGLTSQVRRSGDVFRWLNVPGQEMFSGGLTSQLSRSGDVFRWLNVPAQQVRRCCFQVA